MIDSNPELSGIVVWGIITVEVNLIPNIETELKTDFGEIILKSSIIPFDFTDYYEKEMGKDLKRCWLVTKNLIPLDRLAEIKNYARKIEGELLNEQQQRKINLDPGFLTLSNFVLATTKNYGHRIYLKDGIFAEVTLMYRNKSFQALEWTYPDYCNAIEFFNEVRKLYHDLLLEKKLL
jgi:hypothetical protein